jgi:hypothetical protein
MGNLELKDFRQRNSAVHRARLTYWSVRHLIVAVAAFALAACTAGIPEFAVYQQAFDAQHVESNQVLDRLGQAERIVEKRGRGPRDGVAPFDPDQAQYYVQFGDPPLTSAIRGSLNSVQDYNETLTALATGEAAEALTSRIGAAASSTAGAASAVAAASGVSTAFAPAAATALAALLPIFERLAAIEDRAEFRAQFLAAYPDVRALLMSVRDGTPDMFEIMKRSYVVPGSLGGGTVDGVPVDDLPRLEADRRMLAGWVILIDRSIDAMDTAVETMKRGGAGANIDALTAASLEVRVLAETIKTLRLGT